MINTLLLATLALTTPVSTPANISVNFTTDSVYTYESIINPKEVIEQENGLYTIVLAQDSLLGYCIYDNTNTEYLDGLKFDNNYVTNYTITDVDLSVEHYILIKTVYTDDVAGMLAAAKDGDWSVMLSNPMVLFQIFYYVLAAISIVLGGFGCFKSKNKKIKSADEIAAAVANKATEAGDLLQNESLNIITNLVTPVFNKLQDQNQAIIEALILAQSGDKDSKLALINLLKKTASEDVTLVTDSITKAIQDTSALKEKAKQEAAKVVDEIATGNFVEDNSTDTTNDTGGISI